MRLLVEATDESYEFDGVKTKSLSPSHHGEEVYPRSLMAQLQATFVLGRVAGTGLLIQSISIKQSKLMFRNYKSESLRISDN